MPDAGVEGAGDTLAGTLTEVPEAAAATVLTTGPGK